MEWNMTWWNMIEWILTSSVLIAIVLLIRLIFKRRLSARLRYGIWLLVLVRLLLPFPLFDSGLSMLSLLPDRFSEAGADLNDGISASLEKQTVTDAVFPGGKSPIKDSDVSLTGRESGNVVSQGNREASFINLTVLRRIWAAGMAVSAFILAGSNLLFLKKVCRSRKRLEENTAFSGNKLPLYLADSVPMPCMTGLFRPAIYVRKQDIEDVKNLSYIVRHEYTHYRHGDHVWSFLRALCLILHWYNPLVWAAAYCSKQDAELACDESVVRSISAEESKEYGELLLSLTIQNTQRMTMLYCATTFGGGKHYIKERISRIAQKTERFLIPTVAAAALCIAALVFTFTGNAKEYENESENETDLNTRQTADNEGNMRQTADNEDNMPNTTDDEENNNEGSKTSVSTKAQSAPALSRDDLILYDGGEDEDTEIFVRDYLADMNGDGISDVIRLSSMQWDVAWDESLNIASDLRRVVEGNQNGYYMISVYDGARAGDMENFSQGMTLSRDAVTDTFELAQAHTGNMQYSYFVRDGKGYFVWNTPYVGMGEGGYDYEIFTYTEDWQKETVEEASVYFLIDAYLSFMWVDRDEFIKEYYPIDEMIEYTEKLKAVLDNSILIMDTSTGYSTDFRTCFDETAAIPDAYGIWYWDERLLGVDSPESLREKLTVILDEIMENIEMYREQ